MTTTATSQYRRRHSSVHPIPLPSRHSHIHGHNHNSAQMRHPDAVMVPKSLARRRFSETDRGKDPLQCHACGKEYKHISALAKHQWEHTPEWTMTKKLLISKHQQVQLLEAASILVGMTEPMSSVDESETPISQSPFSRSLPQYGGFSSSEAEDEGMHFKDHSIPSSYSPMPGYVGGYIDVPGRKPFRRMDSPDEEEEGKENILDEEEEILGKME